MKRKILPVKRVGAFEKWSQHSIPHVNIDDDLLPTLMIYLSMFLWWNFQSLYTFTWRELSIKGKAFNKVYYITSRHQHWWIFERAWEIMCTPSINALTWDFSSLTSIEMRIHRAEAFENLVTVHICSVFSSRSLSSLKSASAA